MSLFIYDKAMYGKINGIYDTVIFGSPDEAFKINASRHEGRVLMPFISVWRLPDFSINRQIYNDSRVKHGAPIRGILNNPQGVRNSRGLPVILNYQIDIYSNKRITCDGIAAELVLALSEFPYIDAVVEDIEGQTFTHQHAIVLSESISDNTSISEFEDTGRIYRLTIEAVINEAIIYRIDRHNAKLVEKVLVDIGDLDTGNILEQYDSLGFDTLDESED